MSFARFEDSLSSATNDESAHSNQAFHPADYWTADALTVQAGGGKSTKVIRVASADEA